MRFAHFSVLLLTLPIFAVDETLLSALRTEKFEIQGQSISEKGFVQRYQWLSPFQLSYSVQRLGEPQQTQKNFVVSIEQPIFKSGGIYAQMRLGDAQERLSLLQLYISKNESLQTVVDTAFALRRNSFLRKKQALLVENATIDVDRKKALYLAGLTDGSFLDNAMLAKNAQQLALLELLQDAKRLEAKFKAFSDANANTLQLPTFSIKADEVLQCSAAASTCAGTASSMAASSVHRPSPESETRPAYFSSWGSLAKAAEVRSRSHDATTLPLRQTSDMSTSSKSY